MAGGTENLQLWAGAVPFVVAAAVSVALIVLLRPLLQRYALARPNARSSHREPTPQGGGIAVIGATLIAVLLGAGLRGDLNSALGLEVFVVLAATLFITGVGGVDDLRPLPVVPRLVLQAIAAAAIIALFPGDQQILPFLPPWVERLGLLLALTWFVNLVNFMDGIDWMTVAEVVPLTAAIILLGLMGTIPPHPLIVALALLGATLGFAPFNKPVAKLFLGDVGSLPIGLLLGWLLLQLAHDHQPAAALLLPLYYLADTSITLLRRIAAGESFWQAHRSHFYQRACDNGFTVPAIVARVFLTNLALAALALITVARHDAVVITSSLAVGAILVTALLASFARKRR